MTSNNSKTASAKMSRVETKKVIEGLTNREKNLEISRLWNYFGDFTRIPRKSQQEYRMVEYAQSWAKERGFSCETDKVGNVLITLPSSRGMGKSLGVVIQAHLDMVCVGEPDPAVYGVTPVLSEDGVWLTAKNTTLGADNGIGLAAGFVLLEEKQNHGPLALMLTVGEETGLTGALGMSFKNKLEEYKYLLNYDNEDEGEAAISCAGGGNTTIILPIKRESFRRKYNFELKVEGLLGGHSGVQIDEERLNAIKVMTKVLLELSRKTKSFKLVTLIGGDADNVIPSWSRTIFTMGVGQGEKARRIIKEVRDEVLKQSKNPKEQELEISLDIFSEVNQPMTFEFTKEVIDLLSELPHGVANWSKAIEGLVETSTNLAMVDQEEGKLKIELMTRSSKTPEIDKVRDEIRETALGYGAEIEYSREYPGWPANLKSKVNKIAQSEWKKLTGEELKIVAIHAGLECGVILEKYPHLEAISVGPTIKGAHSVNERVEIDTVERFFVFAKNILQELSKVK